MQIIVADDGLQHYALQRDFELAVFPAADVGRPLDLLPNGNLREPLQRLESVNAVLLANSTPDSPEPDWALPDNVLLCLSRLQCGQIYRLHRPHEPLPEGYLKQRRVIAAAAIAKPERFFAELARLGIETERQMALPDHAAWQIADLPAADCYIVTEKGSMGVACVRRIAGSLSAGRNPPLPAGQGTGYLKTERLPENSGTAGRMEKFRAASQRKQFCQQAFAPDARRADPTNRRPQTMDKKYLDLLVCPLTKGALEYHAGRQELWSRQAKLAFPIRDGIPIMLENEARPLTEEELHA